MIDLVMAALVFGCGVWVGAIGAAFVIVRKADAEDFDGGYSATSAPPARTRIWSDYIDKVGRQ